MKNMSLKEPIKEHVVDSFSYRFTRYSRMVHAWSTTRRPPLFAHINCSPPPGSRASPSEAQYRSKRPTNPSTTPSSPPPWLFLLYQLLHRVHTDPVYLRKSARKEGGASATRTVHTTTHTAHHTQYTVHTVHTLHRTHPMQYNQHTGRRLLRSSSLLFAPLRSSSLLFSATYCQRSHDSGNSPEPGVFVESRESRPYAAVLPGASE